MTRDSAKDEGPWTMSVPAAGKKYFGIGKNASYRAADRGEIPTIEVGGLKRALVKRMERKLVGPEDAA